MGFIDMVSKMILAVLAVTTLCLPPTTALNPFLEKDSLDSLSFDLVPPAPTPPPPKCKYNTSTECMGDECCNWCGLFFNTTIGFCLPLIPVPIPALVCERVPATCKTYITPTDCSGSGDCKWVPMGPPGSLKGLCVYDWDKCKAPVPPAASPTKLKRLQRVAAAEALEAVLPPAPKKSVCNMTVQAECDKSKCCQWCGSVFNLTAGFCMPMMDIPVPTLTCSKGGALCTAAVTEAACADKGVCSWHPFGPPGSKGPGMCTFDSLKCLPI